MTSPAAIADMIRRGRTPSARVAVVTAAAAGPPMSVTVQFVEGGEVFRPVMLAQSTVPAVGAQCIVLPVEGTGAWVYVGTWAPQSVGVTYYTLDVLLVNNWEKYEQLDGSWSFQADRMAAGFYPYGSAVSQGRWTPQQGSEGEPIPTVPPTYRRPTVLYHNARAALDAIAAASGTVHMVELTMRRSDPFPTPFVSPVMLGHNYTTASPPVAGSPPTWNAGYGPVQLAPLATGQRARWVLPAEWVTGLATGAITGIGFDVDSRPDALYCSSDTDGPRHARLTITYTATTEVTP